MWQCTRITRCIQMRNSFYFIITPACRQNKANSPFSTAYVAAPHHLVVQKPPIGIVQRREYSPKHREELSAKLITLNAIMVCAHIFCLSSGSALQNILPNGMKAPHAIRDYKRHHAYSNGYGPSHKPVEHCKRKHWRCDDVVRLWAHPYTHTQKHQHKRAPQR